MKRSLWLSFFAALGLVACGQPKAKVAAKTIVDNNTLLWRITGKDLTKPSYLFGTMHMICATDIGVSDSLRSAIQHSDGVYLELDLDDMSQMLGAIAHMNMRGDTTLADLLPPQEFEKIRSYFDQHSPMIPFRMMQRFKPLFIESLIMEQSPLCENMVIMEKLVMEVANEHKKDVKGLETIDYQLSIFDSIPYAFQAKQLLKMVETAGKGNDQKELQQITDAYRKQELSKMDDLTKQEEGIGTFADLLLYNRNANWVSKLQELMPRNGLVIAVGAGHLPGDKGVISLLRKAGYKVEPVANEMIRKKTKEI